MPQRTLPLLKPDIVWLKSPTIRTIYIQCSHKSTQTQHLYIPRIYNLKIQVQKPLVAQLIERLTEWST